MKIFERLVCPSCGRLRFSVAHLWLRAAGWCDGKGWLW